ncbi:protein phosphatase [Sorangium cellulosum]|jgi:protein phosphatase|uniref:Protein phosphatase n=1 Tax=Sorangium cellulosum TaxID=56 RepID=A0A4P2Q7T5_SORCE|nr:protein phosphatase 2C domain-containing protein [Sorangium cellulosum]AUX25604.1 protein phosphatase [Sorangium cellulosum]
MRIRSFGRTDVGRHRRANEDAFFRDDELRLYVVADGMGGHAAGEVASAEAVETIYGMVKRGLPAIGDRDEPLTQPKARAVLRILEGAIQAATYMVFAIAELDRDKSGMGTTISAALVVGGALVTGQVGDSRIYQVRNGTAVQMTEDHTLIAWQIKNGLISADEARSSPHRNVITRAVGNRDYVEVDTSIVAVEPGDRYLLCSDGLHGYLQTEEEIASIASQGGEGAVDLFIDLANRRGGRDNITAVLVEVG